MRNMFESAVSAAVARDISRGEVADRLRCRTPKVARLVVAQIERFARTIAHRIVRPRRDLVFPAVDRPCVSAALGSGVEAERWIGDDVDPRRRRRLAGPKDRHIFSSVSREAAEPVEEFELGGASPFRRPRAADDWLRRGFLGLNGFANTLELFEQTAALCGKSNPGDRGEQVLRFGRDQVGAQQEDAAWTLLYPRRQRRAACPQQGFDRDLEFLDVRG